MNGLLNGRYNIPEASGKLGADQKPKMLLDWGFENLPCSKIKLESKMKLLGSEPLARQAAVC